MANVLVHTTIRVHYGLNFLHLTGFYQDTTFRPLAFMSFRQSSLLMPSNGPKLSASNNTNPTNRSFCLSELRTKWPNTAIPRNGENHDLKHSFLKRYLMITFCYRIHHYLFCWVDLFFLINCIISYNPQIVGNDSCNIAYREKMQRLCWYQTVNRSNRQAYHWVNNLCFGI